MLNIRKSQEWFERAQRVVPSCTQTFSKGPSQFVQGVAPIYIERGKGSHVWDVDGNEYIDWAMALGPIILGHAYPRVNDAIKEQLEKGITFTQMHPLEVEVAELIVQHNPSAEMVRFGKNGSDATTGAVRVARAFTGRDHIACAGYHGWHDWFIASTTRDAGIPKFNHELIHKFTYNQIETLEALFKEHPEEIAAVILEPNTFSEHQDQFLNNVQALCKQYGAVLIFDEVVTGLKLGMGGAQAYYGVTPDLTCMGKALANGMPLSAIAGKREIMRLFDDIFYSFTFGGEALSLAAAKATILELEEKKVHQYLWEKGEGLKQAYNDLARRFGLETQTFCEGVGPRTIIRWKDENGVESLRWKSLFQQECLQRGILFTAVQHMTFSHSDEDIQKTLAAYEAALEIMQKAAKEKDLDKYFKGKWLEPVFRQQ